MTYGANNNNANASMPTVRNHLEYDSFGKVTKPDNPSTAAANDGDAPGHGRQ